MITEKNIERYQKLYENSLEKFDQLAVGDVSLTEDNGYELIIEKNDGKYKAYDGADYESEWALISVISEMKNDEKPLIHRSLYSRTVDYYLKKKPELLLKNINKIFSKAGIFINDSEKTKASKIKFLKEICEDQENFTYDDGNPAIVPHIEQFLLKFKYDKLFLKKYKNYIKVKSAEDSKFYGQTCFFDTTAKNKIRTLEKSDILKPELGNTYKINSGLCYPFLCKFKHHDGEQYTQLMNWYDKTLIKYFDKNKLGYQKVPIENKKIKANAWEITSGLEDFQKRPIAVFASHDKLKLDCETLPKLEAAAHKFGINPKQLNIINNFIIKDKEKITGHYNQAEDKITLSNKSLSLLAHEATHRMVHLGMIPQKEYRAMIAAGRSLVLKQENLISYINKKNKNKEHIYPVGKKRNEEYAAIFVEKYYENQTTARKALMGVKISNAEKILNYIKEVKDIINSRLGNNEAIARSFLRKIEKNKLIKKEKPPSSNLKFNYCLE